ncbi:unnamed protein product [Urochloa decumbens]|uniref:non-specific serine/threonine protein kinase n=1 Tax=Urochloa decumbens TaxID=240449 RepID=A0ABC9G813_9POAL
MPVFIRYKKMGSDRRGNIMAAVSSPFVFWLCYLLLSSLHLPCATSLSFDFNFSQPGGYNADNFTFLGDAYFDSQVIELTKNDRSKNLSSSVGRASYKQPVAIWDEVTGELASFTTTFSMQIELDKINNVISGDGMAFFLAHYPSSIPSSSAGSKLGLFSEGLTTTNATGDDRVVAVEFDTYLNKQFDTSDNHMGIDINSLISKAYTNTTLPGKTLTSGFVMTCQVSYNNDTQLLAADLQIGGTSYHVSTGADLRQLLPSVVAIGFSGATGLAAELHRVFSWSFNSTLDVHVHPPPASHGHTHAGLFSKHGWEKVAVGIIGGSLLVAALLVCYFICWTPRTRKELVDDWPRDNKEKPDDRPDEDPGQFPQILRQFTSDELVEATNNFAEELGKGGFATVYKGELTRPTRLVAIKRFKLEPSDYLRKKAFDDEVRAICQVRHPNLVELEGWCNHENNPMLVYELVPEGSLHEHLHEGKSWLSWSTRYKIILDLAHALQYLHGRCSKCVVHGDIKPPNILLDSQYVAKLSDFGLARLIDHGIQSKTTTIVVGTHGYLDPEIIKMGRRNSKSDMYSFGIVLLEMVSGKRPTVADHQITIADLLIDVHSAYSSRAILLAADSKLRTESTSDDREQMERVLLVGLWCAHLDPSKRPDIEQAIGALESKDVMKIPPLSFPFKSGRLSHGTDGVFSFHGCCWGTSGC